MREKITAGIMGLMMLSLLSFVQGAGAQDEVEVAQQLLLPGQMKAIAAVFQYLPDSIANVFTLYALKLIEKVNELVPSALLPVISSLWLTALPFIELCAPLIALPLAVITAPVQSITSALLCPGSVVKSITDVTLGAFLDPVIGWLSYIKMNQQVFAKSLHNLLYSIAFPLAYTRDTLSSLFAHPTTGLLNLMLAPIECLPASLIALVRIPASLIAFTAMCVMLPVVMMAAPLLIGVNLCLLPVSMIEALGVTVSSVIASILVPGNLLKSLMAVRMLPASISIFINQLVLTLFLAPIQLIIEMLNKLAGKAVIPAPAEVLQ